MPGHRIVPLPCSDPLSLPRSEEQNPPRPSESEVRKAEVGDVALGWAVCTSYGGPILQVCSLGLHDRPVGLHQCEGPKPVVGVLAEMGADHRLQLSEPLPRADLERGSRARAPGHVRPNATLDVDGAQPFRSVRRVAMCSREEDGGRRGQGTRDKGRGGPSSRGLWLQSWNALRGRLWGGGPVRGQRGWGRGCCCVGPFRGGLGPSAAGRARPLPFGRPTG
mmetsp:Transcript_24510/g.44434  ORF Transcript_24510/g.44434 Transcript_24510/m.44434 type:complete len:221 (-) Transcript_24510:1397-2059(-)